MSELKIASANPYEVLGWAIAYCCAKLDQGEDPRKNEMPKIIEEFERDFERGEKKVKTTILTFEEIRDLALFCGMQVKHALDEDEKETEVAITKCPEQGIKNEDDGSVIRCKHIAYYEEYPEEGVVPLGPFTK
jgi:hypothetical protein